MNIKDACKILQIEGDITPEIVKHAYRTACKLYHPDVNPSGETMMKYINAAYAVLKDFTGKVEPQEAGYPESLNSALNAIYGLDGLIIEVCGIWAWVTGNTQTHKEALKQAGFKWSFPKLAWYFRPPEAKKSYSRGGTPLEVIRERYSYSRKSGLALGANA